MGTLRATILLLLSAAAGSCGDDDAPLRVWVHYDYMVAADHTHAPNPAAIQMVVDAFRRHGVSLMIDPNHAAIPEHQVVVLDLPGSPFTSLDPNYAGPDAVSFKSLKNKHFKPWILAEWHYVIFGHFHTTDNATHAASYLPGPTPNPDSPGFAILPGKDFVIAMANLDNKSWFEIETLNPLPGPYAPDYAVASVFMHELGHNLGLRHAGDSDDPNFKPNYVSVMNYAYGGLGQPILTSSSTTPSGLSYRIDYSDETVPSLNESSLDEAVGVQSLHADDLILWWVPGPAQLMGPAAGPIDWNGDGDTADANLSIDLSNDGGTTNLTGFDDWAYIRRQLSR